MEQDCEAGFCRPFGTSVGAEFSSEDVSHLYHKVFHVPSNTDEAHLAMQKIAGGDNSWSCVGENVLDVLLEMEREREKKEMLYWDLQLLNAGNLNSYVMDKPLIIHPHALSRLHQSTDSNTVKKVMGNKELCGSVKRVKKAARQCWARLASESVQSILPSTLQGHSLGVRGQAWGCVSLSDVLLLLEVKYDVVTHLLYTEMLQEHHTQSIWEILLPWQQYQEEEELADLADEALESGDMLHLAELPGAFRIYRTYPGRCPDTRQQSWSAVSLLHEVHSFRQQERNAVTILGERLDGGSLRLLCLYINLATLRAKREKMSYRALVAARQSWETWPHVESPCRAEQAALWLHAEEDEQKEDLISQSPQQAVLQLLVLTQEQERKHLTKLIHGVSLEDLLDPGGPELPKEDSHQQAALRHSCIKRLLKIHDRLQSLTDSRPVVWSQHHLEECSLLLLTHLLELQEIQTSASLPALIEKNAQCVQALRDDCEAELQAQRYTNLLQLISDAPVTSGSVLASYSNLTENSSRLDSTHNSSDGSNEAPTLDSPSRELNVVEAAERTEKKDMCTGCGAVMEDLPYLEILCVSNTTSKAHESVAADGGAQDEEAGSATKSYEKQGSLITLAWSKPPEDDTENEAGASAQSQDVRPSDTSGTAEHTQCEQSDREEMKATGIHCDSTDAQSADQQCSTLTLEERTADQAENGGSECDLQTQAVVAETLQAAQPHLLVEHPAINDFCSVLMNETVEDRGELEVEMCPAETESELCDLRGPEPAHPDDQADNSQVTVDCSQTEQEEAREHTVMEREQAREPVSAMERERTMRNLVDMQRKVEQRQQRDRERQLLRVQERLLIVQNRKAEEDLLGLKHTDRLRHLTQDLPQEDKNQQKTLVRERLEQLKRERSSIMQSKRDRNTAGFKELLGPVALHSRETDDGAD